MTKFRIITKMMKTIDGVHIEVVMTDEFITNFVSTNVI